MAGPGRQPTVADEDILGVFRLSDDPVLSTKEVADELDLGRRGTFDRLSKLREKGELQMKKVGQAGAVWWYQPALQERYGSSEDW